MAKKGGNNVKHSEALQAYEQAMVSIERTTQTAGEVVTAVEKMTRSGTEAINKFLAGIGVQANVGHKSKH